MPLATASAFTRASSRTVSDGVSAPADANAASSSTLDGTTTGSIPANRKVASLAGEVDAR